MQQLTIGIPKALLYFRYNIMWTTFFEKLNCNVITSIDTNKDIMELGKKYSVDEACLASKIYMGHVSYLQNKCDYVLVPRICDYGNNKKVCVKFNGLYDIVKNVFPNIKILDYNVEITKHKSEFKGLFKLGVKLTKNPVKVLYAYYKAKVSERVHNNILINNQELVLNSKKMKILIISHPYVVYDKYIGKPIIDYLKKMDMDIIYADRTNKNESIKKSFALSKGLYWLYSRELIGSIPQYKDYVNGIIFLTSFPCGPDSLINELLIRKIKDIPIINIIVDEQTSETGLHTRLESFVDIIKQKGEVK